MDILEEMPKFSNRITECLYAKTFKEMNAADLDYIMLCNTDFVATPAYNPKLKL